MVQPVDIGAETKLSALAGVPEYDLSQSLNLYLELS
jgi:hypothetical protein